MISLSEDGRRAAWRGRVAVTGPLPWLVAALSVLAGCGGKSAHPGQDGSMQAQVPDASDGSVQFSPAFHECPDVIALASPVEAQAGQRISLDSRAQPRTDVSSRLTFLWTATAGTFVGGATGSAATFSCPASDQAGPIPITLAVSDGACTVTRTLTIRCFALAGGAGGSDGGLSNSDAAHSADASAGLGGISGAGGTTGQGGAAGGGGGSGGGSGTGGGGAGGGPACVGDPSTCEGEVCNQCTFGVPSGSTDLCSATGSGCFNCIPALAGCGGLMSDSARQKCAALYTCLRDGRCMGADGDPLPCWCGRVHEADCTAGSQPGDGPCLQQFIDAAGSSLASTINTRLNDPTLPIGAAINLAICRATFCGKTADPEHPSCPLW